MDPKKVGQVIKDLRKKRAYTQTQLAELANCSRSYIAQLERGALNPSLETLSELAKVLGVNTTYIILKAEGVENDDYELIILKNEFPEGVTILKNANKELSESQKKDMADLMSFYFKKERERNET